MRRPVSSPEYRRGKPLGMPPDLRCRPGGTTPARDLEVLVAAVKNLTRRTHDDERHVASFINCNHPSCRGVARIAPGQ